MVKDCFFIGVFMQPSVLSLSICRMFETPLTCLNHYPMKTFWGIRVDLRMMATICWLINWKQQTWPIGNTFQTTWKYYENRSYFRSYSQSRIHHDTRYTKIDSTNFSNQRLKRRGQSYETLCSRRVYHTSYTFSWYT